MSPLLRCSLPLLTVVLGATVSPAAVDFFRTGDEPQFGSQFPRRLTPTFTNASDDRLMAIVTPQVTATQVTPAFASLLDSATGFVWTTTDANPNLGRLRLDFAQPVVAASLRYNWVSTGTVSGAGGALNVTLRSSTSQVAEFFAGGLPYQQGWLGVSDTALPFSSIDIDFSGMSGNLAFYFYGDASAGAIEYVPAPALAGDYNSDGSVNSIDYFAWRSKYGSTVAAPAAGADGNADSVINAADYTAWRDKLSAQPAAIPEPTSLAGVAVIASLFAMRALSRRA